MKEEQGAKSRKQTAVKMAIRLAVDLCCPGTRLEECTTASLSLCDVT
jgi:hypothetical protein